MKCDICGEDRSDVRVRIDPYDLEIKGESNMRPLCDGCEFTLECDV